jgi:protein-glucosylgalactosylhydroxylysine glucosidase
LKKWWLTRRSFLARLAASAGLVASPKHLLASTSDGAVSSETIDRRALVQRHNPSITKLDPLAPLTVGNGEFAFTADITGLQTFPLEYEKTMPLCTMAHWGWHTTPLPNGLDVNRFRLTPFETHGRPVGYQTSAEGQTELYNWLRQNPHRLHLGRIGLRLSGSGGDEISAASISQIVQDLDLWAGILTSRFAAGDRTVKVITAVHPDQDLLAVRIESPLINQQGLAVRFAFPYGSPEMTAADWKVPQRHQSKLVSQTERRVRIERTLDQQKYYVEILWQGGAAFRPTGNHEFVLEPGGGHQLEFAVSFSPQPSSRIIPDVASTYAASARHWQRFWATGAAVDFSASRDPRANELERRVVLSQYLTAINSAGSLPPQETGLTVNSWYGKFHLEMHWWHAAHFALWNRLPLLEKSLSWYERILPSARERARSQGYRGARWPKMVGPEGRDSPSPIGPLLIWQQPHPISFAELCYQVRPSRATLDRYRRIVFETAEFMASYAFFEKERQRFVLGPPVIPAQENHPPNESWNPTFELAYWIQGLRAAQLWRERLGLRRVPQWDEVIAKLSLLPVGEGVYLAHENCPRTFSERNYDHPSMLGALGVLSGERVNKEIMRRTLKKVFKEWRWADTWGWDYPMTAMTAARLAKPELAIDALLMETEKNRYLLNGHNWQRENLPCYLPGNGGLLYAVALMAAGWKGSASSVAPGFPKAGWKVKVEGFNRELVKQL